MEESGKGSERDTGESRAEKRQSSDGGLEEVKRSSLCDLKEVRLRTEGDPEET